MKKKKIPNPPAETNGAVEIPDGETAPAYSLQQIADALGEEMLKKKNAEAAAPKEERPAGGAETPSSEPAPAPDTRSDTASTTPRPSGEEASRKIAELEETVKRLVAENRNQKTRLDNDLRTKVKFANELFFREFILIKDDLEKALSFAPENGDERAAAFVQGIRHLDAAVTALLKRHGVEAYDALGQPFDPALHEAMRVVDVAGAAANTVTTQYCKGYRFFERVLRPAMVEIASGKTPAEEKQEEKGAEPASQGTTSDEQTRTEEMNSKTDHTEDTNG